jgi:trigger factor
VELVVQVKGDSFLNAVDTAFKKNANRISVPGFRKGKAPRAMIERYYGKKVFYEDAIEEIYPEAYSQALDEAGVEPSTRLTLR